MESLNLGPAIGGAALAPKKTNYTNLLLCLIAGIGICYLAYKAGQNSVKKVTIWPSEKE